MTSKLKARILRLERQMWTEDCRTAADQQLLSRLQAARDRMGRNHPESVTSQKEEGKP